MRAVPVRARWVSSLTGVGVARFRSVDVRLPLPGRRCSFRKFLRSFTFLSPFCAALRAASLRPSPLPVVSDGVEVRPRAPPGRPTDLTPRQSTAFAASARCHRHFEYEWTLQDAPSSLLERSVLAGEAAGAMVLGLTDTVPAPPQPTSETAPGTEAAVDSTRTIRRACRVTSSSRCRANPFGPMCGVCESTRSSRVGARRAPLAQRHGGPWLAVAVRHMRIWKRGKTFRICSSLKRRTLLHAD